VTDYPIVLIDIVGMGILQVFGQVSIYYVIVHFKQHMFPLISTTRKMITILVSIFMFDHSINEWQWFAIAVVFLGMFYELYE
jgi:UDP-galactose transporter B1